MTKRRLMAGILAPTADLTLQTAEDPRIELLDDFLAMMAGAAQATGNVTCLEWVG